MSETKKKTDKKVNESAEKLKSVLTPENVQKVFDIIEKAIDANIARESAIVKMLKESGEKQNTTKHLGQITIDKAENLTINF